MTETHEAYVAANEISCRSMKADKTDKLMKESAR